MKQLWKRVICLMVALLPVCVGMAVADQKEDAVKMVKEAVEYMKANGREKALDTLNDPKGAFVRGDLYVFAYDDGGVLIANSLKQSLVGMNLMDLPDSKGKKFRREIVERANRGETGWVDYVSQHPKTSDLEEKTTYFQKEGGLIFACGVYKK
jgi:signal transduction histidine kinase